MALQGLELVGQDSNWWNINHLNPLLVSDTFDYGNTATDIGDVQLENSFDVVLTMGCGKTSISFLEGFQ